MKDRIFEEVYIGLIPYHTEQELKSKGIEKVTYIEEFVTAYEKDVEELWHLLEPHMKKYCSQEMSVWKKYKRDYVSYFADPLIGVSLLIQRSQLEQYSY